MNKFLLTCVALFVLSFNEAFSQTNLLLNDSLIGFDEKTLIDEAPYKGITAEETPYYIAAHRRDFIKQKYHLKTANTPEFDYSQLSKTSAAACVNEDFEEGSLTSPVPGTINVLSTNAINGWTAWGSTNSSGGANGNCLNTYTYGAPSVIQLIAPGPSGLTDAIIGAGYRIHSVFGDTLNTLGTALNGFNCYGKWFAKINNQVNGSSVNRLTKTINVTPSNVYFNFAVMVVMEGGHNCCDGGAISIVFRDCLGNLLATAQQYSIATQGTVSCATASSVSILTSTINPNWRYSKWSNSSIDLTPWMGQCVVAQFTAFDCTYTGHAGYAYVDAQCAPVVVNGVNTIINHAIYKLYPNPNAGNFSIEIGKEVVNGEFELRDMLGQVVNRQNVKQGNNFIKTENLAKGIYSYSILSNKEIVSVGKLVIE